MIQNAYLPEGRPTKKLLDGTQDDLLQTLKNIECPQ